MDTIISVPFYTELIRCVLHEGPFPDIERAVSLLLGTVAQESAFTYTRQMGGGPARGYPQFEPASEASVWNDFLAYQPTISAYVTSRCGRGGPDEVALEYDMVYGILLMRILYFWRDANRLPAVEDIEAQSVIWKQFYNTPLGHGTEEQFLDSYVQLVSPHYPPVRRPGHG
jgi:hypothetical protein